jgi:hypothetical protein
VKKIIGNYVNWLNRESGRCEIPNAISVFFFSSCTTIVAVFTGVPAFQALLHGIPPNAAFVLPKPMFAFRNGDSISLPIMPLAPLDAAVTVIGLLLILSCFAFWLGWLNRFREN